MSVVSRALRIFFDDRHLLLARLAILSLSIVLAAIGVFFVHSTTAAPGEPFPGGDAPGQLLKLTVGIAALLAVMSIDYRSLERYAYVLYGVLLVVLGGLLILKYAGGAGVARWVSVGGLNIQPSELMKVALVLVLARYLRYRKDQVQLGGLVRPVLLTTIPMGFVVLQPDLGTSLMLPPILLVLLYVANAKRVHLGVAVLGGVLLFPAVLAMNHFFPQLIRSVLKDYQMMRLIGFLNQTAPDLTDINYQLRQSLIAFGSGGWSGKGYHAGTQNLGQYVPAKDTDFIFSVIGEELGFLGTSAVVVIYSLLALSILHVALNTREPFSRLVVTGLATIFVFQGFENFGMTLGLTPITGLPLPFVSSGGSSLVTSCVAIGVVLGIAGRRVTIVASPDLNPHDDSDAVAIFDDKAAGANLYPNSSY